VDWRTDSEPYSGPISGSSSPDMGPSVTLPTPPRIPILGGLHPPTNSDSEPDPGLRWIPLAAPRPLVGE